MANGPASPLPLAHLAANSAALLVFDEWNDFFPSPVGYSVNGEQQVYWDIAYTFDKFQQEGKSENTPLRKFVSQMRSVATSNHSHLEQHTQALDNLLWLSNLVFMFAKIRK